MALTLVDPLPKASRVTVFGLGWTGTCAANLLRRLGKDVTVTDTRDPQTLSQAMEALRHRMLLNFEGLGEGLKPDDLICEILEQIA